MPHYWLAHWFSTPPPRLSKCRRSSSRKLLISKHHVNTFWQSRYSNPPKSKFKFISIISRINQFKDNMLHNTRTRSPLFHISAMGTSQVQAAQRHTAFATDRKGWSRYSSTCPSHKVGNRSVATPYASTPHQKQYLVHDRYPPRGWVGGTILARSQLSAEQSQSSNMQRMKSAVFQQSRIDRKHK